METAQQRGLVRLENDAPEMKVIKRYLFLERVDFSGARYRIAWLLAVVVVTFLISALCCTVQAELLWMAATASFYSRSPQLGVDYEGRCYNC